MSSLKFILFSIISSVILMISACSYLPNPIMLDDELVIEEKADYILITTSSTSYNQSGIIFYPGGLVDPHAYINPLKALALEDHRVIIIVKAPSNLAIINSSKASSLITDLDIVDNWVVGGHSLGGSVSCIDVFNNPEDFSALFLLAAYSVDDLSSTQIPVLSITGSNDAVLDLDKFEENRLNLPNGFNIDSPNDFPENSTIGSTIYYEIKGGNHAQFGDYGDQSGDGMATIDMNSQQSLVLQTIRRFLSSNKL